MNIILNSELEQLINEHLAIGKYNNIDDLLKDALLSLSEKRERQLLNKKSKTFLDKPQDVLQNTPFNENNITQKVENDQQLEQLAGTWTETDELEFLENTKPFREIDESLWK